MPDADAPQAPSPQMPRHLNVAEQAVANAKARLDEIDLDIASAERDRDAALARLKDLKTERTQVEKVANSLTPRAPRSKS